MIDTRKHLAILENMDIPSTTPGIAHKLELYLSQARKRDALHFWAQVAEALEDDWRRGEDIFFEELHFRVAYYAFLNMAIDLMEDILADVPERLHNHQHYVLMSSLLGHTRATERYENPYPLSVLWGDRHNGPHLFEDSPEIQRWAIGRVETKEDEKLYTMFADYHRNEDGDFEYQGLFALTIPFDKLRAWGTDRMADQVKVGHHFELVSQNLEADNPRMKWAPRRWDGWDQMPPEHIDRSRYLREWGWLRNGQTFIERAVRGEVDDPQTEIHDEVDAWHRGDVDKPDWTLADHLGMLPEEYALWVKEPEALSVIIERRRGLWKEKRPLGRI